jgi:hypothetical protein
MNRCKPKTARPVPSRNGTHRTNGHARATTAATVLNGENGGRDKASGRFQKGNPGGPDNKTFRDMCARRRALLNAISEADIAVVGRRLLADSLAGDHVASWLLLEQVVGKPLEGASEDRADLHELALRLAAPLSVEVILAALDGVSPSRAIDFIRAAGAGGRPGIDTVLDKFRAAHLADLRAATLAARAGQT